MLFGSFPKGLSVSILNAANRKGEPGSPSEPLSNVERHLNLPKHESLGVSSRQDSNDSLSQEQRPQT